MAEAIGVTAGLLAVATFVFQLSKEVYDLVDSIQKAPQTIRDLKSELVALDPILSSICTVVTSDASTFEEIRLSAASVRHGLLSFEDTRSAVYWACSKWH